MHSTQPTWPSKPKTKNANECLCFRCCALPRRRFLSLANQEISSSLRQLKSTWSSCSKQTLLTTILTTSWHDNSHCCYNTLLQEQQQWCRWWWCWLYYFNVNIFKWSETKKLRNFLSKTRAMDRSYANEGKEWMNSLCLPKRYIGHIFSNCHICAGYRASMCRSVYLPKILNSFTQTRTNNLVNDTDDSSVYYEKIGLFDGVQIWIVNFWDSLVHLVVVLTADYLFRTTCCPSTPHYAAYVA